MLKDYIDCIIVPREAIQCPRACVLFRERKWCPTLFSDSRLPCAGGFDMSDNGTYIH